MRQQARTRARYDAQRFGDHVENQNIRSD